MSIAEIEEWGIRSRCTYGVSFGDHYLVLFRYTSAYLALLLFVLGLLFHELYLMLMGFGLTLNAWLNFFVKWAIQDPVPEVTCGSSAYFCIHPDSPFNACGEITSPSDDLTCGWGPHPPCEPCVPCGMPSFEVQQSAFFVTAVFVYSMQWSATRLHAFHHILLVAFHVVVSYVHLHYHFNTVPQIVVATFAGAAFDVFFQLLVFWAVYPHFDSILRWKLVRYLGYRDTLCR